MEIVECHLHRDLTPYESHRKKSVSLGKKMKARVPL
jgi:hypothetical protein